MKTENSATKRVVNKFNQLAKDVIKHHFGKAARRIVHRSSGLTNFVFSVKHSEGDFVIRIAPEANSINSFTKEQWAQKAAREAGVPVPEILEVGLEAISYPYMISTRVDGIEATHHPERFEILREMGHHAAAINSIRTSGFGETFDWSENRLSLNTSYKNYLQNEFRYEEKLKILDKNRMLTQKQIKGMRKIFAAAGAASVHNKPVLNHSDMRLKNVIVNKDGKINGIIDWEGATSNIAPQWEISLALHDLGIDGKQHFLDGYGLKPKELTEMMPLVKAFNVANYSSAVSRAAEAKDKKALDYFRSRMSGTLDLYSF